MRRICFFPIVDPCLPFPTRLDLPLFLGTVLRSVSLSWTLRKGETLQWAGADAGGGGGLDDEDQGSVESLLGAGTIEEGRLLD
jgi:hypothetical protein